MLLTFATIAAILSLNQSFSCTHEKVLHFLKSHKIGKGLFQSKYHNGFLSNSGIFFNLVSLHARLNSHYEASRYNKKKNEMMKRI